MRLSRMVSGLGLVALLSLAPSGFVAAQEAAVAGKPRAADMAPKATQALMLGLANSGKHLFAVGDFGEILASNDGHEWQQVQTPVRSTLTAVYFVDENNGWAVGYEGAILHTTDGGKRWAIQNYSTAVDQPFLDVHFTDLQHGMAIGAYGLLYETTDGGTTWAAASSTLTSGGFHLYRMIALGNGSLFTVGEQGLMMISSDQGKTWTELAKTYEGTLFNATPIGNTGVVISGLRGNVFYAADAAHPQWKKIETGTTNTMFGCAVVDSGHVVLAGVNGMMLMADLAAGTVKPLATPVDGVIANVLPLPGTGSYLIAGESGVRRVDLH